MFLGGFVWVPSGFVDSLSPQILLECFPCEEFSGILLFHPRIEL